MPDSLPIHHKRVLLKLSGSALSTDSTAGIDFQVLDRLCEEIKTCVLSGAQLAIVVGGSNLCPSIQALRRSADSASAIFPNSVRDRSRYEHMGMLATIINALALTSILEEKGLTVRLQTAIDMRPIAEPYIAARARRHLEKGRVVIIGAGTGNPYFSTDAAAALRAAELGAEVILLGKSTDPSLDQDPKSRAITYDRLLAERGALDATAATLAQSSHLPTLVFSLQEPDSIINAVKGSAKGVIVY